jgi:hypothetical protein
MALASLGRAAFGGTVEAFLGRPGLSQASHISLSLDVTRHESSPG